MVWAGCTWDYCCCLGCVIVVRIVVVLCDDLGMILVGYVYYLVVLSCKGALIDIRID